MPCRISACRRTFDKFKIEIRTQEIGLAEQFVPLVFSQGRHPVYPSYHLVDYPESPVGPGYGRPSAAVYLELPFSAPEPVPCIHELGGIAVTDADIFIGKVSDIAVQVSVAVDGIHVDQYVRLGVVVGRCLEYLVEEASGCCNPCRYRLP